MNWHIDPETPTAVDGRFLVKDENGLTICDIVPRNQSPEAVRDSCALVSDLLDITGG